MIITDLKPAKKHLLCISLSNGESLLLDSDLCAEKCLHTGDEMTAEKIKEYTAESDYIRAKSRALWLLDRYQYSERRLMEKLMSAGFGRQASEHAVNRLKELQVISDEALACRFAEECARRSISKREAYQKLRLKGFSSDTVNSALENARFDECSQITSLLEKKYKAKLLSGETDKVYAALIRKGFSYQSVRECMKKYSEELEFSGDI